MALSNVRQFLNPQRYGVTGRQMKTSRELGFNPMVEAIAPANTPQPVPKSPVEEMMFPSEPFVVGEPKETDSLPGGLQGQGIPGAVEAGVMSQSTADAIENGFATGLGFSKGKGGGWEPSMGTLIGATAPVGQGAKAVAGTVNALLGDPWGKASDWAKSQLAALFGLSPEGPDPDVQGMAEGQIGPLSGGLEAYGSKGPGPSGDIGLAGLAVGDPGGGMAGTSGGGMASGGADSYGGPGW